MALEPMDLAFLRERYDFELERKDKLTTAVGFPVAILSLLGGMSVAMARYFTLAVLWISVAFLISLVFVASSASICLYWLLKVYHGQSYAYLPKLADLEVVRSAWRDLTEAEPAVDGDRDFFNQEFREYIIETTDRNSESNDIRAAYLDRANSMIVSLVVSVGVAGVSYVLGQISRIR